MHLDPARAQYRLEAPLHAGVVRWNNGAVGGKQMENHQAWIAAQRQQFGAQAMLHRQQQLDPARTRTDHRDGDAAALLANALAQSQPTLVERVNGLDRHRVRGSTRHLVEARR